MLQRLQNLSWDAAHNPPPPMAHAQVRLMHSLLRRNNPQEDLSGMASLLQGDLRAWRLLSLHNAAASPQGDFQEMLRTCLRQYKDAQLWHGLDRTESMASLLLSVSMRPAAVVSEEVPRLKGFPFKLLSALQPEASLRDLLAEAEACPCLLDSWSADFISRHNSEESLSSQEAKAELGLMADLCVGNIHGTETQHSKHTRRARGRAMTHPIALQDLSLWNSGWAAPLFAQPPDMDG